MAPSRMLLLIVLFCFSSPLLATETDQFTLPPGELMDLGPMASQKLYDIIARAKNKTNFQIKRYLAKADKNPLAAKKLAYYQSGDHMVDLVSDKCGPGYPRWLHPMHSNPPMEFGEFLPWKKVYWLVFSQAPSHVAMAPTIRLYDYYFGTDKITHFFMFGKKYYKLYQDHLAKNETCEAAHAAMVNYGEILEKTILGTLLNGIYSNADLVANYAGWKFYTNLTEEITIGHETLPPILVLQDGLWEFSPHIQADTLLKPYLSDGFNEAWNPCRYSFSRGQLQKLVKERCTNWISRLGLTAEMVQAKLEETSTWHGEPYGHWLPKDEAITLDICFKELYR